jgi:mono/diheme cytochrome c family protein
MTVRSIVSVLAGCGLAVSAWSVAASGPSVQAQQTPPTIKEVPIAAIVSVEGKDSFAAYCAVCHGHDGKGGGPAAPALKMPVPDLTMIAKRHGGTFNAIAIERIVAGLDKAPAAHGTGDMPMWGPVFRETQDQTIATMRLRNLVKYLQSIQTS